MDLRRAIRQMAGGLLGFAALMAAPALVWAGGSCPCTPPTPACGGQVTSCTDSCGGTYYSPPSPPCCVPTACTPPPPPSSPCGQYTQCSDGCGGWVYAYGPGCPPSLSSWQPYGYAIPGDPKYSFGLSDNNTKDLLALAAKGNVILGDYTSQEFQDFALPKLGPGSDSLMQPYAIDPTDAALGYHTGDQGLMYDAKRRPLFDGNYDQEDGGYKRDKFGKIVGDRKFYESSLSDDAFRSLVDMQLPSDASWTKSSSARGEVDAVIFTNHLLSGYAPQTEYFYNFGSMVARDDAFMFKSGFWSDHDIRLSGSANGLVPTDIGLPMSVGRPKLLRWKECPPDPNADCSS